ncbi:NADPH oxidase regulator NoxR [Crepidotus variabilis]|uniref:NADPH oxidase regulator NoxR n=1 Tax=Crepidotus variabilis TaxID=179855 RepID=A0A9P6E7D6_9AGAR|nr:NADPH oxidase regulator NoxR [Crepidotus variabilis]
MSLKAELETWAAALKAYDDEEFEKSLELFTQIADSSKILTNMGLIYATLGEHEAAVKHFIDATSLDQYLAVAYFQCGVSNFLLGRYDLAYKDFDEALLYLRGNQAINYEQLGLKFRLFSAEVLFNKGLSQIYLGKMQEGLADMEEARREKATEEHSVIDDAITERGEGYTVFSIPVGVLYRPSEKKLKNAVTKDYMGKARLVASSNPADKNTEFKGVARLKAGITPGGLRLDRPDLLDPNLEPETGGASVLRSATVPPVMPTWRTDGPKSAGVERSNTSPFGGREGSGSRSPKRSPGSSEVTPTGIARSNTQIAVGRPSANAAVGSMGGPVRGLSIKRPGGSGNNSPTRGPQVPSKGPAQDSRLTEFYDDYIDSYGGVAPPMPPPNTNTERVGNWARNNANPALARAGSRSAPTSQYAPSSYGGTGSVRRRGTKRSVRAPSRIQSTYDDEEEGYGSGEYDEVFEMNIIRVKVHYQDDTRGMTMPPDVSFGEFMDKVTAKFGKEINGLDVKFTDEDGTKITLRDDSDFELAIETARESAKGKPEGKLVLWCSDR